LKVTLSVSDVRDGLLILREEHGWSYDDIAAIVKKRSGERYNPDYIGHFLRDDQPGANWTALARAILHSIPSVARHVCPYCKRNLTRN